MEDGSTVEHVKAQLTDKIFSGKYPPGSTLPGERSLAEKLKTNRTTLRKVMYDLEGDGLLNIHHGKPTQVAEFWKQGNLNLLDTVLKYPEHLPENFMLHTLYTRTVFAPIYTELALRHNPDGVIETFLDFLSTPDDPLAYAEKDWKAHSELVQLSENPIFVLLHNSFEKIPRLVSYEYFLFPKTREDTLFFYTKLHELSQKDIEQTVDFLEFGLARGVLNWYWGDRQISREQAENEVIKLIPTLETILIRDYY